jgi:cell division septum initiation protein DivIVA
MSQSGGFGRRGINTPSSSVGAASTPARPSKRSPLVLASTIILGAIAFAGGVWGGREAVQQFFGYRASVTLDRQMADMEKLARAKYPHLDPIEAVSRYAREAAPDMVNAGASERDRTMKAAATFFGFYHINTRSRVEHCANLGVDLAPFARAIERSHRREYNRAIAVASEAGMTEERLYAMVRSQLASLVKADMDAIARRILSTSQGACQTMLNRADEFADKLDFTTLQPQVRRILMGS